ELVCRNEVPLKPNPAGLYKLKEALDVQKIIFIGNSLDDQEAAINAGTDFVAVKCCERVRIPQVFLNNVNVMKNFHEISSLLEQKLKYFSLEEQPIN
ncbi:HAD family hydrolase, partial [Acinetobacter seifertii]|uniref:HAD family hydrolase n=1 Tax=Acinetobacter seifertii TaxID=1530123 RepID=UPI001580C420